MFIDANQSGKVNPIEIITQIKKSKNHASKQKNRENQITEKSRKSKTLFPVFFNISLSLSLLHQTCYNDFFSNCVSLLYDVAYK